MACFAFTPSFVRGQHAADTSAGPTGAPRPAASEATFYIREYRIKGAKKLPAIDVERAVYAFLGPERTQRDVESARLALEQSYHELGYQTVSVVVPEQTTNTGIIRLQVVEATVARLRVKGAKYFSPSAIKQQAPSLAEGKVINFNDVPHDIVALNQVPDRQVTPSLRPGAQPGTVDVDLDVKDKRPLHASLEINNRHGPDTSPLRLNGSISDNNLWQSGNSAGLSFQTAPQKPDQVKVFSAYFLKRFSAHPNVSVILQGTELDSNVSTLGAVAVAGRGETFGPRVIFNLSGSSTFAQSINLGIDYKHFRERINLGSSAPGTNEIITPKTYYPISSTYTATWVGKKSTTELNASANFHLRGMGSSQLELSNSRYKADGDFIYFRGDLSRTQELPYKFQLYGKLQAQVSNEPLLSPEQFTGGGTGTVRGYLEAEAVGDNGYFGTLELRSPSLLPLLNWPRGEWRVYGFVDGGKLTLNDPLPEQKSHFYLASYGVGSRIQIMDNWSGAVDAAIPFYQQAKTKPGDVRVTFRAAIDF